MGLDAASRPARSPKRSESPLEEGFAGLASAVALGTSVVVGDPTPMGSTADTAGRVRGPTEYAERQYACMSPDERKERVRRARAGNARDLLGDIGAALAGGADQDFVGGEDVTTGEQWPLVSEDGHCGVCGHYFYRRFLWRCGYCSLVMCVPRQCASNHVRRCPPGTRRSVTHTCIGYGPCFEDAGYEDVSDESKGQEARVGRKEDEGGSTPGEIAQLPRAESSGSSTALSSSTSTLSTPTSSRVFVSQDASTASSSPCSSWWQCSTYGTPTVSASLTSSFPAIAHICSSPTS